MVANRSSALCGLLALSSASCALVSRAEGAEPDADIAAALAADQAAAKKGASDSGAATGAGLGDKIVRAFQSLNPDLSAIVDFSAGWYSDDDGTVKSGDDPGKSGFNVQEIELALKAEVDPYFRADIYLTIPNLKGLEVEEAFLTTTHLPGNLQLKAGIFRAAYGRQNTQHLHVQDFTRRPHLNSAFLGVDGLRSPGMELNWLVPRVPFYLLVTASLFSVGEADLDDPLQSFGGGARWWDFTYVGSLRTFVPMGEATSLFVGLNYARGLTSQRLSAAVDPVQNPKGYSGYNRYFSNLYGIDLYVKWKPPNQAKSYSSVAWQTEYFLRQLPTPQQLEGGLYSQLVFQMARRWYLGVRGELLGIPAGDNVKREYAGATSLTWALSEFARVRLYGELRHAPRPTLVGASRYSEINGVPISAAAFLQFEASIGPHGAHAF